MSEPKDLFNDEDEVGASQADIRDVENLEDDDFDVDEELKNKPQPPKAKPAKPKSKVVEPAKPTEDPIAVQDDIDVIEKTIGMATEAILSNNAEALALNLSSITLLQCQIENLTFKTGTGGKLAKQLNDWLRTRRCVLEKEQTTREADERARRKTETPVPEEAKPTDKAAQFAQLRAAGRRFLTGLPLTASVSPAEKQALLEISADLETFVSATDVPDTLRSDARALEQELEKAFDRKRLRELVGTDPDLLDQKRIDRMGTKRLEGLMRSLASATFSTEPVKRRAQEIYELCEVKLEELNKAAPAPAPPKEPATDKSEPKTAAPKQPRGERIKAWPRWTLFLVPLLALVLLLTAYALWGDSEPESETAPPPEPTPQVVVPPVVVPPVIVPPVVQPPPLPAPWVSPPPAPTIVCTPAAQVTVCQQRPARVAVTPSSSGLPGRWDCTSARQTPYLNGTPNVCTPGCVYCAPAP